MTNLHRTPLYSRLKLLGAKFVPFAGWEMPLEFEGILKEHQAVRTHMGIFDVSHMGEIEIRGPKALEFCQWVTTNDVSQLHPGKVQYSAILNEQGGILDDCTLYCLGENHYLFVINASRREEVFQWFLTHNSSHVSIQDRSLDYGLLALQGRKTEAFLSQRIKRDLSTLPYYEFWWAEMANAAVMISRTGYTGEDGFEIYVPSTKLLEVWDAIMEVGRKEELKPIGLGARDTLRLEMGYLLNGSDMNPEITPLEVGLSWIVKMEKGNFLGKEALQIQKQKGLSRRLRGIQLIDRGIPRSHHEIYSLEPPSEKIGIVTSGTYSPSLKVGVGLAFLPLTCKEGQEVKVLVREKKLRAQITKPPFVQGSIKK